MSRIGPNIGVVINADDFGYSQAVNQAVHDSIQAGLISSATIMANGPALREALAIAACHPQTSFGVHLNLTEFRPLLPATDLKPNGLIDQEGNFLGNEIRTLRPSPKLLQACYEELTLQIQTLLQMGLKPSHLDSHHHVHTIPWLLPVIAGLQQRFKIFKLRNTMNVYDLSITHPGKKLLFAKQFWRQTARLLGSEMTQRFTSLRIFFADPFRDEFRKSSSIELMCHPGQSGFESETEELFSKSNVLLPKGYQLVSYHQFHGHSVMRSYE